MIGITLGLFIVAAASMVTTSQLSDNRQLMMETQVQQELRAAADLITRDLRRAGYWQNADTGVWLSPDAAVVPNPNKDIQLDSPSSTWLTYDAGNAGVRLGGAQSDTLEVKRGGAGYQPITDPAVVRITQFQVALNTEDVNLGPYCIPACDPSVRACPTLHVRQLVINITGQAKGDASIQRSLNSVVRLPNDALSNACP